MTTSSTDLTYTSGTFVPVYKDNFFDISIPIDTSYSFDCSILFRGVVDHYDVFLGSLPDGFTLNSVTGILSGFSTLDFTIPISIVAMNNAHGGAISSIANLVATFPGTAPVAVISEDADLLPLHYRGGYTGYWPTNGATFTGITSYEGYAPHPVYFSGWTSTSDVGIAEYKWDFGVGTEGDQGGRYFIGINAGHLFETDGSYTVTLTTTDLFGRTSTTTRAVTIHASGSGNMSIVNNYALTTYYVDSVIGDDTYDGKSPTVSGTVGPWKTFNKVIAELHTSGVTNAGDKIMLNRGQAFLVDSMNSFGYGTFQKGVHIGAYGSGAKPKIQWTTPVGAVQWANNTAYTAGQYVVFYESIYKVMNSHTSYATGTNVGHNGDCIAVALFYTGYGSGFASFTDLDFQLYDNVSATPSIATNVWSSRNSSRNVMFARCNVDNPFNCAFSFDTYSLPEMCYGLFLFGNTVTQKDISQGSVVLLVWGNHAANCMIGNSADQSGNHICYLGTIANGIIADNVLSRPAFGRTALRITGGPVTWGSGKIHILRNKILGWIDPQNGDVFPGARGGGSHNGSGTRYNYELINLCNNGSPNEYNRDIIFEQNIVTNYETGMRVSDMTDIVVRNNLFVSPSEYANSIIYGKSSETSSCKGINTFNNTFVHNGNIIDANTTNYRSAITLSATTKDLGYHERVSVSNNVFIATANRIRDVFFRGNALQGATFSNNLVDSGVTNWSHSTATGPYDLPTVQATYGIEANSLKTTAGVTTTPVAARHTAGFPDSQSACITDASPWIAAIKPEVGSALIDAGLNTVPVYTDYTEASVPRIGKDIGAIQH